MANSIIGAQLSIGPALPTPIRLIPQPHWKTATSTPYAAPMDNKFMITAFSGTSKLRNTAMSRRNESERTPRNKYGMRPPIDSAKSTPAAVKPPTFASTPVCGMTFVRKLRMSASVCASCGEVVGYAMTSERLPSCEAGIP